MWADRARGIQTPPNSGTNVESAYRRIEVPLQGRRETTIRPKSQTEKQRKKAKHDSPTVRMMRALEQAYEHQWLTNFSYWPDQSRSRVWMTPGLLLLSH